MRDDLAGRKAPRWAPRFLRRYGLSPSGEPRYRLIWSAARLEFSGGTWNDVEGGRLLRRVREVRRVRKYPGAACWLIERWTPPEAYGAPEDWPAAALGPYPAAGDYEDIGARIEWYPSERHLAAAVGACERALAGRRPGMARRVRERVARAEEEQRRRDAEYERWALDALDDASPAFEGAPMIAYGEKRRPSLVTIAESAGIRQHPF